MPHAEVGGELDGWDRDPDPIRPLALLNALIRRRWLVCSITLATTACGVGYAFLQPPVYAATAKFLPVRAPATMVWLDARIGPSGNDETEVPSSDYYIALVQSPTFLESIATASFVDESGASRSWVDIAQIEGASERERILRGAEVLSKQIAISAAKPTGAATAARLVTVTAQGATPELAAGIAQKVLELVTRRSAESRGAKSRQNREFITTQLKAANDLLDAGTDALANFSARNRKVVTPALQAEEDRLQRVVRVQEEVVVTLTKQLEMAKIREQEARESIEVIQAPEPPLTPLSPRRTQLTLTFGFLGLFAGCGIALLAERLRTHADAGPDAAEFRAQLSAAKRDLRRVATLGLR